MANWVEILKLSTVLLSQAMDAFAAGHRKEAAASVQLPGDVATIVQALASQQAPPLDRLPPAKE